MSRLRVRSNIDTPRLDIVGFVKHVIDLSRWVFSVGKS